MVLQPILLGKRKNLLDPPSFELVKFSGHPTAKGKVVTIAELLLQIIRIGGVELPTALCRKAGGENPQGIGVRYKYNDVINALFQALPIGAFHWLFHDKNNMVMNSTGMCSFVHMEGDPNSTGPPESQFHSAAHFITNLGKFMVGAYAFADNLQIISKKRRTVLRSVFFQLKLGLLTAWKILQTKNTQKEMRDLLLTTIGTIDEVCDTPQEKGGGGGLQSGATSEDTLPIYEALEKIAKAVNGATPEVRKRIGATDEKIAIIMANLKKSYVTSFKTAGPKPTLCLCGLFIEDVTSLQFLGIDWRDRDSLMNVKVTKDSPLDTYLSLLVSNSEGGGEGDGEGVGDAVCVCAGAREQKMDSARTVIEEFGDGVLQNYGLLYKFDTLDGSSLALSKKAVRAVLEMGGELLMDEAMDWDAQVPSHQVALGQWGKHWGRRGKNTTKQNFVSWALDLAVITVIFSGPEHGIYEGLPE